MHGRRAYSADEKISFDPFMSVRSLDSYTAHTVSFILNISALCLHRNCFIKARYAYMLSLSPMLLSILRTRVGMCAIQSVFAYLIISVKPQTYF